VTDIEVQLGRDRAVAQFEDHGALHGPVGEEQHDTSDCVILEYDAIACGQPHGAEVVGLEQVTAGAGPIAAPRPGEIDPWPGAVRRLATPARAPNSPPAVLVLLGGDQPAVGQPVLVFEGHRVESQVSRRAFLDQQIVPGVAVNGSPRPTVATDRGGAAGDGLTGTAGLRGRISQL